MTKSDLFQRKFRYRLTVESARHHYYHAVTSHPAFYSGFQAD